METKQTAKDFLARVYHAMMKDGNKPQDHEVSLPSEMYVTLFNDAHGGGVEPGWVKFMGFTVIDGGPELSIPFVVKTKVEDPYALARSSKIQPKLKLNPQGTHYKGPGGTKLCVFCKKDLDTHPRCRRCSVLIHRPNPKYPDAAQVRRRVHDRRLCAYCYDKHEKPTQGRCGPL